MKLEQAHTEIIRLPFPPPSVGQIDGRLEVPALTVIVGACVVPSPEDDHDDLALDGYEVEVLVDDAEVIAAAPLDEAMEMGPGAGPGFTRAIPWRTKDADPVVLTPREDGVGILVTSTRAKKKKKKRGGQLGRRVRNWSGWQVWLYVVR